MIEICEKHRAFAAEWELLGRPALEFSDYLKCGAFGLLENDPRWVENIEYRIAGDRHWKLRKRWLDSGKTMPIEALPKNARCLGEPVDGEWVRQRYPNFNQDFEYREAREENTTTDVSEERLQISNEFDEQQGYFDELGNAYIEFGTALKNPKTVITDLVLLANKLGLALQVRIVGNEQS